MKKVRMLMAFLMLVVMGLTTGCAQIFSDVTINSDSTGTWKSKIFANKPMKKEDLEGRLAKSNILIYTINPINEEITAINPKTGAKETDGSTKVTEGWEVITEWKTDKELTNIVNSIGDGLTLKQHVDNVFAKNNKNDADLVTVDMGMSTENVTIHINGSFVKESVKGEIIDGKTIKYTKGKLIKFQFYPAAAFMGITIKKLLIGGGILLVIGCGGYVFYRRRSEKKVEVV